MFPRLLFLRAHHPINTILVLQSIVDQAYLVWFRHECFTKAPKIHKRFSRANKILWLLSEILQEQTGGWAAAIPGVISCCSPAVSYTGTFCTANPPLEPAGCFVGHFPTAFVLYLVAAVTPSLQGQHCSYPSLSLDTSLPSSALTWWKTFHRQLRLGGLICL